MAATKATKSKAGRVLVMMILCGLALALTAAPSYAQSMNAKIRVCKAAKLNCEPVLIAKYKAERWACAGDATCVKIKTGFLQRVRAECIRIQEDCVDIAHGNPPNEHGRDNPPQ